MHSVKPAAETATAILDQPEHRRDETLRRLRTLFEDDEAEQRETFAYLHRVLEEDRPSTRPRFGVP